MQIYQLLQEDTLQIIENIDMNFVDEPKKQKQSNNIFTWRLSNKNNNVDCRTDESSDFKLSLGFKLYDMVHRKQQTITRSIKDVLEVKSMQN